MELASSLDTDDDDGSQDLTGVAEKEEPETPQNGAKASRAPKVLRDRGKPGFFTIHSLDCDANCNISVRFEKTGAHDDPFTLVKVCIIFQNQECAENYIIPDLVGDDAVDIMFETMSAGLSSGLFPKQWAYISAATSEWVSQAKEWLRVCQSEHATCQCRGSGVKPTRLIDISDRDHPKLMCISGASEEGRSYAALSYVWGAGQTYVLKTSTLQDMQQGLKRERLPQTIKDAISVALQLDLGYLWVDAICIIQDDALDKARELPMMGDIYRNSTVTIVAASASSCTEGFLQHPAPIDFFVHPFPVPLTTGQGQQNADLHLGYRSFYKASADPINSRAWTLQERILSTRCLVFASSGVMWVCGESQINPGGPPNAPPPFMGSLDNFSKGDAEAIARDQWHWIMGEYTARQLTFAGDKLPAISAVAAEVARRTGWTYLAGLWKENLFSELHWKYEEPGLTACPRKSDKARAAGYIAPSWSRASVAEGIAMDSEDERDDREPFSFQILHCEIEHPSPHQGFQFGPVSGGVLEVQGKVVELGWRPEDCSGPVDSHVTLLEESANDLPSGVGEGSFDPLDTEIPLGTKLVCLAMSSLKVGRWRIAPIEGLLLLPADAPDTFRRVGFFRVSAPSVFHDTEMRIIRVI
ncbi:heterokaryon incompatibility protein-domain-containing protein [Diaporthe sp. PMI_573]|nr:heterokaryon incompatibility protein-domain-containing protein [Diaporthaceae sp. PMI_573]